MLSVEWLPKLLETLSGYAFRWRTRAGLLSVGVTLLVATSQVFKVGTVAFASGAIAVSLTWLVIWSIGSGQLWIPRAGKTIVLSIKVDVEAERNFNRIIESLKSAIRSLPLAQPLQLQRIGFDQIRDDRTADRYLENDGVAQVIWGHALAGKANNEQIQKFELHWHQQTRANVNVNAIVSDVALLSQGRSWTIAEVNELVDVSVIAEDFLEMSLAIIGIMLLLDGNIRDGAVVFARVVRGLQQHHGQNPTRTQQIKRFDDILQTTQLAVAADAHSRGDHAVAIAILVPLLTRFPNDIDLRLNLARAYFCAGDRKAAVRSTNEIAEIDKSHPAVFANRAFFCILEKKYKRAGEWYRKLIGSGREKRGVLTSVSAFLEDRYNEEPEEHAYLYGLAIVNGIVDPSVLADDLSRFMDLTQGMSAYEPLRQSAKKLLGG